MLKRGADKGKGAIIDQVACWMSIYLMIQHILDLESLWTWPTLNDINEDQ